ncbi:MAG: DUF1269 domain-containing protein [Chloroflexota bacterium]|nr:MAG: DUF1269 domain-containing protein [Chloroflexota bacterium]
MSDERKESLFVVSYSGRDTADEAYDTLRQMEKDKQVDIKTAMVVNRKDNGKLKLKHKRRLTVGKGLVAGGAVGILVGGAVAPAILGGAAVGALVGSSRSGQRRELKGYLEDKLGPDDSALAVLIKEADWAAVNAKMEPFGGEDLKVELTAEDQAAIDALSADEEVAAAVNEEEEEVVDDDNVEVVEE